MLVLLVYMTGWSVQILGVHGGDREVESGSENRKVGSGSQDFEAMIGK